MRPISKLSRVGNALGSNSDGFRNGLKKTQPTSLEMNPWIFRKETSFDQLNYQDDFKIQEKIGDQF